MRQEVIRAILRYKIIAIIRNVPPEDILFAAEALYLGGIRLLEVTFDQASADGSDSTVRSIELLNERYAGRVWTGAGTVMSVEQVYLAANAGARFILSPNTDQSVIEATVKAGLVSIPAALTPTEAANGRQWGADMIKLFPAGNMGAGYVKALQGPMSHIPYLAVGGIDDENMMDFFKAGVKGVGVGSNLVNSRWIREGRFTDITEAAKRYTSKLMAGSDHG